MTTNRSTNFSPGTSPGEPNTGEILPPDVNWPRIIGLAGPMGAGKDTVAGVLVARYGYRRVAFADGLREEASTTFPDLHDEIYRKPTSKRARILLQWWGTEYRRAQDELYWVKKLSAKMNFRDRYVISDVRFPNEEAAIRQAGGETWAIYGRTSGEAGVAGHASEDLKWLHPSRIIDNSGTIEDLGNRIHEIVYPPTSE